MHPNSGQERGAILGVEGLGKHVQCNVYFCRCERAQVTSSVSACAFGGSEASFEARCMGDPTLGPSTCRDRTAIGKGRTRRATI
eukprot:7614635-Pyramimonas_sp.AAC.1